MKENKVLNITGVLLEQKQLNSYLEKIASEHILQKNTNKNTYPIPRLISNFKQITKTYNLLNLSLKLGINIHPAGEWLLDNYYVIEETYKVIKKELTLKKYTNFVGISNGEYSGFARVYVLASEIIAYTDGKIDDDKLVELLNSYQTKKRLDMEEIWNINIFFNISLIEKIREICEKIYFVQIQKYKVESIIERLIENKQDQDLVFKRNIDSIKLPFSKEAFIEYLSYRLNQYGKKAIPYINILEEQVEKIGSNINDIIKKEHYDIAIKKLLIGNYIKSIKKIQRINFIEIFDKTNVVEEILRKDPSNIYKKMTQTTKEYYRNKIKEIANKNKISEIYLANKALDLAKKNIDNINKRKNHIGYYIIDEGIKDLKKELKIKINKKKENGKRYISLIFCLTSLLNLFLTFFLFQKTHSTIISILFIIYAFIPISEIVIKIIQYIFSKIIKPEFIPKIDFSQGINEENATMVIVPTILKSKDDVKKIFEKLEVYYLANKSKNIYFTLLGDCSTSSREDEFYDKDIIEEGKITVENLNQKYKFNNLFNFIYRKRRWNSKEKSFLGWERKRGIITEFNRFLLGDFNNTFLFNSFNTNNIPKIKYIITLDSDTNLVLESAKELIGAMAHVLNTPVIDKEKNIVIKGYGIMQPKISIDINSSRKNLFTKIYAGMGGIDAYSNAISDIYQDNFGEGTFTGKGIYNLEVFSQVLDNAIPENTVLSHDLLEGIYARCGLLTDVTLLDSCPTKYNSYIARASRWIRGDWQIVLWLKDKVKNKKGEKIDNPINELGKYKIFDNLRRSLLEITQIKLLIFLIFLNSYNIKYLYIIPLLSIFIDLFIDILNTIMFRRIGEKKQSSFENKLPGLKISIVRSLIDFSTIIHRSICYGKAILVTLYRVIKSKEHLLEWMTSEETEKLSNDNLESYIKEMWINSIIGLITVIIGININSIIILITGILWLVAPLICWYVSKKQPEEDKLKMLNINEVEEIKELAKRTWKYFEDNINENNNYLPPDNYQEYRKEEYVNRTSSTNIGLSLMSIISAYDLNFINLEKALSLIKNSIETIGNLEKWNGHLFNWYNINTLEPLTPKYVSTVDSGNFIGYLITLKTFLYNIKDKELIERYNIKWLLEYITELINETDFSKLYNQKVNLFSIGFNVQENKLTDSYYDLLASEARQASLVAIAKKDITTKHWYSLSRSLTSIENKKGLLSWSGTLFEYLMPNINIKKYKGSLLDESCKFAIMSQKKYSKKLNIPWGISEAAFNLKDLNSNYQYKAFGIPWLGLKRGLENEIVVSSYGSVLALKEEPKEVLKNIRLLKRYNMYGKYGLYESIDFTPERMSDNNKYEVVKTYMAHHQALILLSINNLINNNILQKRFHQNPEIEAVDILLQEKLPEEMIITKEIKEKIPKIKYSSTNTEYYQEITKINNLLPQSNVISNGKYTVYMNKDGAGYSKFNNILINRYKKTDRIAQGVFFYFKNKNSIWTSYYNNQQNEYKTIFTSDMNINKIFKNNISTEIKTIITPDDNVEIRNIELINNSEVNEKIEVASSFEPVLSNENQDYAHKAFNNLFLKYEKIQDGILIKRNERDNNKEIYMAVGFFINKEDENILEYEIDREKFVGRLNTNIPYMIEKSNAFSNKIRLVTDPIIAFRRKIEIKKDEKIQLNLIISVSEDKNEAIEKLTKYKSFESVKRSFNLSRTRNDEMNKYLDIDSKEQVVFQKILSYLLEFNPFRYESINNLSNREYKKEELWKFGISGDLPILLIQISKVNNIYVLNKLLKAFKYYLNKNILIDLVVIYENKESDILEKIMGEIADKNISYYINNKIFVISNENNDTDVIKFKANYTIDADEGNLENTILEKEEEYLKNKKEEENIVYEEENNFYEYNLKDNNLKYFNGYGGFSENGKEYLISVTEKVPAVWCNVLANKNFGTIVTQNLGGFSWYKNSRLNRISKWSNDAILDVPSEEIFIQDDNTKKVWKMGKGNLLVTYGFGYSKYNQKKDDIEQELITFVSMSDNVKINLFKIKNNTNTSKKINIIYKIDTVLDEDEIKSDGNIKLKYDLENDILMCKNIYGACVDSYSYIYSSEKNESYTGNIDSINIFSNEPLNKDNSLGRNSCMAIKITLEIQSYEEKEISLILAAKNEEEKINIEYKKIQKCKDELLKTKKYWEEILGRLKVKTPDETTNIILNGWAMYQTISSRLFARSGFYQSGGAFGFRDQLQDVIGLKFLDKEVMKEQIIKHAKHQFIEGDVEHWWHEETNRGIRTRFSDDRLWLAYVTMEYVKCTGDNKILKTVIPYIEGKILEENKNEDYNEHLQSNKEGTLYEHCKKAIDISLKFGNNGLPLIGTGDWNDGFNKVGENGKRRKHMVRIFSL